MKPKIKVLPVEQIIQIAAGEVVRRPASVIKELCENSLDAGAKKISIHLEKAGKELIKVVDDGQGMCFQDAQMCTEIHATSKIEKVTDLLTSEAFGFRGEALPSICKVSDLEIWTKPEDQELGTYIKFVAGEKVEEKRMSMQNGTTIAVSNLFHNVPARAKFLKKDESETGAAVQLIKSLAVVNYQVHFEVFHKGLKIIQAPRAFSYRERIDQIFGSNVCNNLIEFKSQRHDMKLIGYASNLQVQNYNRNQIYIFVNKRIVRDVKLISTVIKSYQGSLPNNKYPTAFLFLEIDKNDVDINVHPAKDEVVFDKHHSVLHLCKTTIIDAIENYTKKRLQFGEGFEELYNNPAFDFSKVVNLDAKIDQAKNATQPYEKTLNSYLDDSVEPDNLTDQNYQFAQNFNKPTSKMTIDPACLTENTIFSQKKTLEVYKSPRLIGQLFATYILLERDDEFILLDQHAAHERVIYQDMKSGFETLNQNKLTIPKIVTLRSDTVKIIERYAKTFNNFGIGFSVIGEDKICINNAPDFAKMDIMEELFERSADIVREEEIFDAENVRRALFEHVHSHTACKSAVKSGDLLSQEKMKEIVYKLEDCENKFMCIHGRPTMFVFKKSEIGSKFRRFEKLGL